MIGANWGLHLFTVCLCENCPAVEERPAGMCCQDRKFCPTGCYSFSTFVDKLTLTHATLTHDLPVPAALLHHNASDVRLPFAAAAAIAAYLSVYLLAGGSSSGALQQQLGAAWCQQLAVPPMQLVSGDRMAALLRLFKYRLGSNGPPMLEAVEGVACRSATLLLLSGRAGRLTVSVLARCNTRITVRTRLKQAEQNGQNSRR